MKIIHKFLILSSTLFFVVSCGETPSKIEDPILENISLSGTYQTSFTVDDSFTYEGLIVTAHYSDNSIKTVKENDYNVSTPDMSTKGVKEVTVTYLSKTATYSVTVNEKSGPQIELIDITLSGTYNTEFEIGDTFTYDGLIVTAIYNVGEPVVVTPTSVSSPNMDIEGKQVITVTYLTKSKTYTITISAKEIIPPEEEEEETYKGYLRLSETRLEIKRDSTTQYQVLPIPQDFEPEGNFPYEYVVSENDLITISKYGTVKSAKNKNGKCTITCRCTDPNYSDMTAICYVTVMEELPVKQKGWVRVDDYDSLSDGDILVMASPAQGVTASLDTLHSHLNPVTSTFSSNMKTITSLGEGSIEFVLGLEDKGMTLEAQTGEYLVCTHQGKVKLDSSSKTNKYWDIHSNIDPETGIGSIDDGAVIENNVESLGYIMFNITLGYFSTYVDNSISKYMALPFLYRLQELN